MKHLVFLDIDGVLVTHASVRQPTRRLPGHRFAFHVFDRGAVLALNRITDRTGAKIVISSTWRKGRTLVELREILADQDVTGDVIGVTGGSRDGVRGGEIHTFLDEHGFDAKDSVILDDDADMWPLMDRLVQTSPEVGLQKMDVWAAVALLKGRAEKGRIRAPWGQTAAD